MGKLRLEEHFHYLEARAQTRAAGFSLLTQTNTLVTVTPVRPRHILTSSLCLMQFPQPEDVHPALLAEA